MRESGRLPLSKVSERRFLGALIIQIKIKIKYQNEEHVFK